MLQKKKKILFVITKSNWGGAQRYVYDLATNLPKNTFEVVVAHGESGELVDKLTSAGIHTIEVSYLNRDIKLFNELKVFRALLALYRKEKPDILHLNSSKIGGLGSLAGRVVHIQRIIFTAHGWAFNESRGSLLKLLIWFISWLTVMLSHIVITVSYKDTEQALSFPFISAKKIHMIYIGIHVPILEARDTARPAITREAKAFSPKNVFWIGAIAELHKNKGLSYAIDACAKLDRTNHNFFFVIIGEGEERERLKSQIRDRGLENHIILAGHIANAGKLLSAFDIFILPSIKEGLPYALLEAGLNSLPVVASRVGGIPEVVEHNVSGLLTAPKDILAIKNSLETLLHDKRLRHSLGIALNKKVKQDFSFASELAETQTVYLGE
ncbi:glycosyltransferase family 4 protein [Patescibacteria group bacterium]|nr:glycosyltransferase family 4 protein [Patescibacteria group bacterium]